MSPNDFKIEVVEDLISGWAVSYFICVPPTRFRSKLDPNHPIEPTELKNDHRFTPRPHTSGKNRKSVIEPTEFENDHFLAPPTHFRFKPENFDFIHF